MTESDKINGWTFKETVKSAENLMKVEKNVFKWDILRHLRDFAEMYEEEFQRYRALGTVEELRIAKEKQIPKKPNDEIKTIPELDENGAYIDADISVILLCPICGNQVGIDDCIDNYCSYCGQKLDWSDAD